MKQTTQYQLNQWEQSDRIMMEDFNADNQKVEQALAGQAEALTAVSAAVAKCGNCKIVYGTYTGSGEVGSSKPNKLTFDGAPIYVLVLPMYRDGSYDMKLSMLRGVPYAIGYEGNYNYTNTVTWTNNSVQWYSDLENDRTQFNRNTEPYYYIALLAADE